MKDNSRLLELDCLRGIAALMVVIFHFTLGQNMPHKELLKGGITGVDLFFMISGFVIFLTVERTTDYRRFLLARFARLFPAYWTCVSITACAVVGWSMIVQAPLVFPTLRDYLINLTMIQSYFNVKSIDNVYWTLVIELLFYLFILLVFVLKRTKNIEMISAFILIFCGLYAVLTIVRNNSIFNLANLPIFLYFPLFISGMIFYKIKFHGFKIYRIVLLLVAFLVQIILFEHSGRLLFITTIKYITFLTVFFGAFTFYCFNLLGVIVNQVTLFLGRISYSLYLIHNVIGSGLLIPLFTNSRHFKFHWVVADFLIVLPIVLLMAAIINKYVEVPALKYLKTFRWQMRKQSFYDKLA